MGLSGILQSTRMKVFLISVIYLSTVGALPNQDRQNGCSVTSWKGDDFCDDENNNAACEYDGGDCCGGDVDTTYCKQCECLDPSVCVPSWQGDKLCDDVNNIAVCEYDGGDCCGPDVDTTFCYQCECLEPNCAVPSWKGDNSCDDVNNVASCEFDGGDCCGPNVDTTYCLYCQCLEGGPGADTCATIPSWMKSSFPSFDRIIDGEIPPAPIPWQAQMRQQNWWGFGSFSFCGGTILDATTILTAAHCYYGKNLNAGNFFIAAGAINDQDGSQQTAFVESIFLHESYNPPSLDNQQGTHDGDIAILKLKTPLTFNDKVGRACLPDATYNPIGITMGVASGWGLIGQGPDVTTSDLMWVTMPVVKRNSCVRPSSAWHPSIITNNMICAGDHDGGESVCHADSGGPLVVPRSFSDDTAIVLGVTSFVSIYGCGVKGYPSVFAYVIPYLDWIRPLMEIKTNPH